MSFHTRVMQNIDDLHERAGSRNVVHMHGELLTSWCLACDGKEEPLGDVGQTSICPACGVAGKLRPNIVWFGEITYEMERIVREVDDCSTFAAIGTSGLVYPAAGFVVHAVGRGAHTVELNLESTRGYTIFQECRQGLASVVVPQWVDELLARVLG